MVHKRLWKLSLDEITPLINESPSSCFCIHVNADAATAMITVYVYVLVFFGSFLALVGQPADEGQDLHTAEQVKDSRLTKKSAHNNSEMSALFLLLSDIPWI
jgi:hypothetical protein